jgi:hypothetical protein
VVLTENLDESIMQGLRYFFKFPNTKGEKKEKTKRGKFERLRMKDIFAPVNLTIR